MYLLCENDDCGSDWEAICVSDDLEKMNLEADRLNKEDHQTCLKRYLSDPRYPKPMDLDDPRRHGYMKYFVIEVPVWSERLL
jgi:hypothetical protein